MIIPKLNLLKSFFVRGLGALSMLILTLTITRNLMPEESGIILQIFSLTIALSLLSRMGSENSLIKYLRNGKRQNFGNYFLSWTYSKSIVIGVLIVLVYILFIVFFGQINDIWYLSSLFYIIPIFNLVNIKASHYQSRDQVLKAILIKNVYPFLGTALLSLILLKFNGEIKPYHFLLFYAIVISVLAYVGEKIKFSDFRLFHKKNAIEDRLCWKISSNYIALCLFQAIQQWGIIILSIYFLGKDELSLINVVFRIGNVLTFVLIAINSIYTQQIASSFIIKDISLTNKIFNKAIKESSLMAIPMFLILLIFSNHILNFFNDFYSEYDFLLIIVLCGQIVNVLTGPVMVVFVMSPYFYNHSGKLIILTLFTLMSGAISLYLFGLFGGILFQASLLVLTNITLYLYVKGLFASLIKNDLVKA